MKHIYLFNKSTIAAAYGIGTYIKQMTNFLVNQKNFSLHIVNTNSNKKEFETEDKDGVKIHNIPHEPSSNMDRYYRNIFFLLQPHIEQNHTNNNNDELIFHFNFYQDIPLIKTFKEYYPKCKIIFSIHYLNWGFLIKGNLSYFKRIIAQDPQNLIEPKEKSVAEIFKNEKEVFITSDKIICLARFTKQLLLEDYKISENKINVIYNGLEDNIVFLSQKGKKELKKKYFIPNNEKIILFVGRLSEGKGIDITIKAFINTIKKGLNYRLIIVGDGDHSRYLKECQDVWGRITFTGRIEQKTLYQFYQIADVGIMPSTNEQCSYVAIEMLAHGIPLIASTTTGLGEMLKPELEYLTSEVKEEDNDVILSVEDYTDKILYVLEQPKDQIKKIRKQCRKLYLERYEISIMKNNLLNTYSNI